jgi:vancomycin resistance protein YoaR
MAQNITLKLDPNSPTITKERLEEQRDNIVESLRYQFVLIDPIYSDDWNVRLTEHLDWVEFAEVAMEERIAIKINQNKLDEFVDAEISKWLDVPVDPVNIYTNEEGKVVIEGRGYDGKMVQRKHLKKAIELAVANQIRNVPIPVIDMEPEITISEDLQALGIKDRISIGHTSYYGSPGNRIHNIKTGAAKFNGEIVAPDEIFSFNTLLGPVDASTGYRKELVIKKEGTIPEYGGGLCQVSTTFYRTILFGGLPVTARREHSYAVSYYSQVLGHGLDATIYLGGQDLQFQNNTGEHILIQTFVKDDYELYVAFYGTSDGREIEMDGPYLSGYYSPGETVYEETGKLNSGQTKQVEKAHTGFKALWYRYITDKNGEQTVETINSHYKAVPAKILVGTGEE